jgi:serine/threonine-protein kinase
MSPEQARGKPVDKRTDIWAYGCVLYEMLTGQAAFQGEDVTEILAAVVKGGADLDLLPANLHPRVREVIIRCLQKDLKKRYHDIADVRYEIEQALADPGGLFLQPVTAIQTRMSLRTILPWIAALVLTAIIAGVAVWKFMPIEPRQVICFSFDLPEDQQFSDPGSPAIAVSPDGRQFVYSTPKGLYMRSIDALTAKPIFGTEGNIQNPFFSPDGKWIGYWSITDQKLKKISANGGTPIALCDVTDFLGARWNDDNTIAYGRQSGDIMRISADGGTPKSIVKRISRKPAYPQILPDGKSVLYTLYPTPVVKIVAQSLGSGEPQELIRGVRAQYLSTEHITYRSADSGSLLAIKFDPNRLKVTGEPVAVLEDVRQYAVSESGTLAYVTGGRPVATRKTLVWVNRKGEKEPLSAAPDRYSTVRISPDGTRVALTVGPTPKYRIWVWDVVRETMTRLTFDEGTDNMAPLWTLDGKRTVYASSRENILLGDLYWKASDGTGDAEKLASSPDRGLFPSS